MAGSFPSKTASNTESVPTPCLEMAKPVYSPFKKIYGDKSTIARQVRAKYARLTTNVNDFNSISMELAHMGRVESPVIVKYR